MNRWLIPLEKNVVRDRLQLGGKAVSLTRLMEIGYPLPPTVVISAEVISRLVPPPDVSGIDGRSLSEISNMMQARVSGMPIPSAFIDEIARETRTWRRYCVRSSSVHEDSSDRSWAGILKSCIDVRIDEIEESIRECVSSLYSLASLGYAASQSVLPHELKMAVILQEYVDGQISGVAFSADPVSHFENGVVLEAAKGPAEQLTDGSIIPDRYVVEKTSGRILDARPGHSGGYAAPRAAVIDVARQVTRLERVFGCAVDVEWTIVDGVFVPLQARPITTALTPRAGSANAPQCYRFWWLDHDAFWQFEIGIRSFETDQDVSANRLTDVVYIREDGSTRCLISADDVMRLHEVGVELRSMVHFQRFQAETMRCLNQAHNVMQALGDMDPGRLAPAQIRNHLQAIDAVFRRCAALYRMCDPYATNAVFAAASEFIPVEKLIGLIAPSDPAREREAQAWSVLVGGDFDETAAWEHVKAHPWLTPNLFSRAAILTTLREKHRASQGLAERPAPGSSEPDVAELPESAREILSILRGISDLRLRLKLAWTSFDFYFVGLYEAISRHTGVPARDLHGRYSIPDMIALLAGKSIQAAKAPSLAHFCDGKASFLGAEEAAEFWQGRSVTFDHADDANTGDELRGRAGSHGKVSGVVCLLNCNDPDKVNRARLGMQDGDVLVAAMIQLNVMDLVQRAGGLITDEGGMLSHAAILAREMAIPCIVGTQRATQVLRNGDRVELDTEEGCVRLIERAGL
jgi:phosphohistidine swiveling domain-containing protein